MADEEILAKIKKLLNLATSDNVNEAANAQAAAQKLLLKHHIDEEELASFSLVKSEKVTQIFTEGKATYRRIFWYNHLANIVAEANLCDVLTSGAGLIWIGKPTDLEVSQYIFHALVNDLTRICDKEWLIFNYEQQSLSKWQRIHGKTWKNSFYNGACQSINERLRANLKELKQSDDAINALIVRNDIELNEYKRIHYPRLSYSHSNAAHARSGFESGKAAGRSIQFRNGITAGGSQGTRLLKG